MLSVACLNVCECTILFGCFLCLLYGVHVSIDDFLFFDSELVHILQVLDLLDIHLDLGEIHVSSLIFFRALIEV